MTNEQIYELIDYLQGSCKTIDEAMNDYFQLSENKLTDSEIEFICLDMFCCESCGWWHGYDEESEDEQICNDCHEE